MAKELEVGDREVTINRSLLPATPSSVSMDVIPPTPETENNSESQKDKRQQASDEETPASTSSAACASGVKRGVMCDSHPSRKKAKVCTPAAPLVGSREGKTPNMIQDNSAVVKTEPPEDESENENLANVVITTATSGEENAPTDETNGNGLEIPPTNGRVSDKGSQSASRNPKNFIYNTRSKSKSTKLSDNSENPSGSSTGNAPTIESPIASTSFQRNDEDPQLNAVARTGNFNVNNYLERIQKNYKYPNVTDGWNWDLAVKSMRAMETMCSERFLTDNSEFLNTCMENTYYIRRNEVVLREITITEAVMYFPGLKVNEQIQMEFGRCKGVLIVQKFEKALLHKLSNEETWQFRCAHKHTWCEWANEILESDQIGKDEKLAARLLLYVCAKTGGTGALKILNYNGKGDAIDRVKSLSPGQKKNLKVERLQPYIQLAGGFETINGNCSVVCEKQTVLSNLSFVKAFFAVYYLFYCFNLEYTDFDRKLFETFDDISAPY